MGIFGDEVKIFDGNENDQITIEGPKMYKRNGYYYIFAPAGGVKTGWQTILRSKNPFGPYEYKVVLRQGDSPVNGPHQGAWVDTITGEDWFLHFQDVYAAGRITHLQPMHWENDWPIIGVNKEGNDYGEPVMQYVKPNIGKTAEEFKDTDKYPVCEPDTTDEFDTDKMMLQWQWNSNYDDSWYVTKTDAYGKKTPDGSYIRLNALASTPLRPVSDYRNLLLQKWPAPEFECVTKMCVNGLENGDYAGIVSLGVEYGAVGIVKNFGEYAIRTVRGTQSFDCEAAYSKEDFKDYPIAKDTFADKEKTVIVDYGGANAAKPLHVGHLRSAVIGESVKRINTFAGNKTIGDVHLGDWGLQMGLIIEELRDRKPELPYFDDSFTGEYPEEAPFTISELEEIYPAASAKSKEDAAFAERAHEATLKLQSGDKACRAIWHHIMNVSKADLKKNYDNLNVHFDLWKGESDAQPYIDDMVNKMIADGIAYESQGATVVDIQQEGDTKELPPCIVRKSDGAALYATSDLATIVEREKLYHPDTYIYLADKRQELHFTQVFRTAKKAGIVAPDADMRFVGFGTMNGKDGKPFKTRSGGVMRLEHLIADIDEAVYEKIMSNRTVEETEARDTAKIVGLAALKYGDLSNQASKDYVFDIERFSSFEGNTGPYILYTIVRIKSILNKYTENGGSTDNLKIMASTEESEKNLSLSLIKFADIIDGAYKDNAPHKICQFIYEVSNAFNGFYHNNKILSEPDEVKKASYIALISLTKSILEQCIDLLAIECPDRM